MRSKLLILATIGLAMPALSQAEEAKTLDSALSVQAQKILQHSKAKELKFIGVLKFLVKVGDGPLNDNAGPLNVSLADRLTVALVLACPDEEITIIRDANAVAARIRGGNHLDEEGRVRLFTKQYHPAWGDITEEVKPDLLITGEARISEDLAKTEVVLHVFGRDGRMHEKFSEFTVATNVRTLTETGFPFSISPATHPKAFEGSRGFEDEDYVKPVVDVTKKFSQSSGTEKIAALEKESPVKLSVFYNDEAIPVANGTVREPQKGEKVWFKIENPSKETYGVVLKVNGVNTIFKEKFADPDCHKWILKPGAMVVVRGFQTKLAEREDFTVLSPEASRANEVRYGEFAGMFQMSVFRARDDKKPEPPALVLNEEQKSVAAISRGTLDVAGVPPGNLRSLQSKLRRHADETLAGRGLVDGDAENPKPHLVEKFSFVPQPVGPVFSNRIQYYQPKK